MNKNNIQKLSISALLLSIGLFLPFLTGQIPAIGSMLLPMHTGVAVRIYLRTEVRFCTGLYPSFISFLPFWDAARLSCCNINGI